MKIKGILRQIWCGITNQKYPSAYVWGYWQYCIDKKGNVKYQHWKTLINFIKNKKTN